MDPSAQGQSSTQGAQPTPTPAPQTEQPQAPPQPETSSVQAEPNPQPVPTPVTTPAPPPPPPPKKSGHNLLFVMLGVVIAFILGVGFDKYKIVSYIKRIPLPKIATKSTPKPTPILKVTPTPVASPTANWKTYTSTDLSFQYPPNWTLDGSLIASTSPKIRLVVIPKNSTLMNECMQQVGAMTTVSYVVKKFIRVTTGEACATGDPNPREIWVIPSINAYSPGISFSYSATEATQAGQLFTELLTTFKFAPASGSATPTPAASPSATKYTCPTNGYVDCMPVMTPEKQAACSTEAMAWYKINCPTFKGAAM